MRRRYLGGIAFPTPRRNCMDTVTAARMFDQAYVDGRFVTPHGSQVIDLVNPTRNEVIGKVTLADEIDTRSAVAAAKRAFKSFSRTTPQERMDFLQRLHQAVSRRMDDLVQAKVLEYGAPQARAKGSNELAANNFLHFKQGLGEFALPTPTGRSTVVCQPRGGCGVFPP